MEFLYLYVYLMGIVLNALVVRYRDHISFLRNHFGADNGGVVILGILLWPLTYCLLAIALVMWGIGKFLRIQIY